MNMREEHAGYRQFLCGLSFLLGGSAGCVIGFLCTEEAVFRMRAAIVQWYDKSGPISCFSAELVLCLLMLLFALSTVGCFFVPAINCLYGAALSLFTFSFIGFSVDPSFIFPVFVAVLASLPVLRISMLSNELSRQVFCLWRSSGTRCFDLRRVTFRIFLSLLLLFLFFLLRCLAALTAQ